MNPMPSQTAPPSCQTDSQGITNPSTVGSVSVEEGYRRWAPTYDLELNPLLALEERRLKPLLPPLANKHVLDLACGTGRWLDWLLAEGAGSGVGIDGSTAMLARAQEKTNLRRRLVKADCRKLPLASAVFDLVICSFALGHIAKLESVAQEMARITKPGADVFLSDLHPRAYVRGWRTGFRDQHGAVEVETWSHSLPELLAAWNHAGFGYPRFIECRLDEPERTIFARAGKSRIFPEASRAPAVLILHFQRATHERA